MTKLTFEYTNHRGETKVRNVIVKRLDWVPNPAWGYDRGWFLVCHDIDRNEERSFRLDDRLKPMNQTSDVAVALLTFDAPSRETSERVSEMAGKYLKMVRVPNVFADWIKNRTKGELLRFIDDIGTLAGSALSQDETPAGGPFPEDVTVDR